MNYRLPAPLFLAIVIVVVGSGSAYGFSTVTSAVSTRALSTKTTNTFSTTTLKSPTDVLMEDGLRSISSSYPSSTSLNMVPATSVPVGAIAGALTGGLFAGGLHAIAGPDHLAALLPRCCGQRWYKAGRIGALWGMGHGLSATLLGVLAFGLKSQVQRAPGVKSLLAGASHVTEIAVGLSLILIGAMGIREAREWEEVLVEGGEPQSLSAAAADAGVKTAAKRAVIFNGLLHGFSWDGAPSLAPALAVATWSGNLAFLSAYAAGTMGAMAITTTLIGEGTRRAGAFFKRPDIPQKLSLFSSMLAIAIGLFWCGLALRP
jgi:hypothetical protein